MFMTADMMALELGEVIRNRREQLKLSQVAAAKRAGISRSTWIELEAGVRPEPQSSTLDRIDTALDWKPGTLRSLVGRTTPAVDNYLYATTNANRQRLVAYSTTLSAVQIEQVLAFVDDMVGLGVEPNIYDQISHLRAELLDVVERVRLTEAVRDVDSVQSLRPANGL